MRMFPLLALAAAAAVNLAGCDNKPATTGPGTAADTATAKGKGKGAGKKDHEHGAGPHGGAIGEFGGKYHFAGLIDLDHHEDDVGDATGTAGHLVPVRR